MKYECIICNELIDENDCICYSDNENQSYYHEKCWRRDRKEALDE